MTDLYVGQRFISNDRNYDAVIQGFNNKFVLCQVRDDDCEWEDKWSPRDLFLDNYIPIDSGSVTQSFTIHIAGEEGAYIDIALYPAAPRAIMALIKIKESMRLVMKNADSDEIHDTVFDLKEQYYNTLEEFDIREDWLR